MLSQGKGGIANQASLLCSLFLGFGWDAYVTMGTRTEIGGSDVPHMWVVTRRKVIDPTTRRDMQEATYWEPLTGAKFPQAPANSSLTIAHNYRTIGCCFNDVHFYANLQ
eukprot:gene8719-18001_t